MDKKKKKPNKAEKEFVKNTIELNPTLENYKVVSFVDFITEKYSGEEK